jgi:hypothetical protein
MLGPELISHLRQCADAYGAATNRALSTISQDVLGDWRFFAKVAEGATFTVGKYDDAMAWFSEHWPEDVKWPTAVPRPIPGKASRKRPQSGSRHQRA